MATYITKMAFVSVVLTCFLFISLTSAVDRGNFKTCTQSSFCKRNREQTPNQSPYEFLTNTLKIHATHVEGELLNIKNNVHLKLQLFGLEDNVLRLRIEEATPLKPRFHPTQALNGEPTPAKIQVVNQDSNGFTVVLGESKAVLNVKPFRLDVYSGDELVISVNSRGLMKFEQTRLKPTPKEANVGGDAEGAEKPAEPEVVEEDGGDESGLWEESFKSHHDSKPNGPQSVGMDFSFVGFDNVYGIPEHADDFSLKQTKSTDPYRMYNLDVFEYELYNPMALYGSIPYMLAHSESKTVGLLWLNAAEMWIDVVSGSEQGQTRTPQMDTHWFAETGLLDFFLLLGPSHVEVSRQYGRLTGTKQVPPLFSLGYHQCRWNYNDQEDVRQVDARLDENDIPYDAIWLDIEHTDGKRYFTWDKIKFPDSKEMITNLTAKGRKMVTIVDPHIKRASGYFVHDEATARGYYIKNKDGGDYDGWCWPGSSSWPDFLNPEVCSYWSSNYALDRYDGSTTSLHIWNDMNEPSVFNGPEVTMHKDAKHFGGWEHREVHNLYGSLVVEATNKGMVARSGGNERPFILSRAFFIGTQRFSSVWTGDNIAEWSHLKISVAMLLSLSVAGITQCGADVGGFFNNPDVELQVRWYQAGAYQPFFRAHAHLDTRRREPYLMDEANMKRVREVIRRRYSYLPYWYTLFYENERTGMPPMRPLWYEFPADVKTFKMDDQYMIGRSLLVHPVVEQGASSVSVYFPVGDEVWYDSDTYERFDKPGTVTVSTPIDKVPVFLRGGTIIPKKERVRRAATLGPDDPYTLIVVLDKKGKFANGTLYIDDGFSFNYHKGEFIYNTITFEENSLHSRPSPLGKYKSSTWLERVVVVGQSSRPSDIVVNSHATGRNTLEYSLDEKLHVLTIRKPSVKMDEEWTITLNYD